MSFAIDSPELIVSLDLINQMFVHANLKFSMIVLVVFCWQSKLF